MNVMFQKQDLVPSSSERIVNHLMSCIIQKGPPHTLANLTHEYTVSKILKPFFLLLNMRWRTKSINQVILGLIDQHQKLSR